MIARSGFNRSPASRDLAIFATLCAFAKAEIDLVDLESQKIVHHAGPVQGTAYRRSKTYFFVFESRESDTTRLE